MTALRHHVLSLLWGAVLFMLVPWGAGDQVAAARTTSVHPAPTSFEPVFVDAAPSVVSATSLAQADDGVWSPPRVEAAPGLCQPFYCGAGTLRDKARTPFLVDVHRGTQLWLHHRARGPPSRT